jgi:hypothetical protein
MSGYWLLQAIISFFFLLLGKRQIVPIQRQTGTDVILCVNCVHGLKKQAVQLSLEIAVKDARLVVLHT